MLGATDEEVAEVIERRARARPAALRGADRSAALQAGRDLLLSNAEEQARESGVGRRQAEPIMLAEEPEQGAAQSARWRRSRRASTLHTLRMPRCRSRGDYIVMMIWIATCRKSRSYTTPPSRSRAPARLRRCRPKSLKG